MTTPSPRVLPLVLVPALITLVVTVLRVLGELDDWGPALVGTRRGGGEGGLIAIAWLMFVFGFWFGIRLQRGGAGVANRTRALLLSIAAVLVLMACMAGLGIAGLIEFPNEAKPVVPHGAPYLFASLVLATAVSFVAWRRAALTLLVYAALARIPVVVVTWLAIEHEWDTHYAKMAPGFVTPPHDELFVNLALPQITFWPAATVIVGTVMACLGAMLAGRSQRG
ncbi:MAG TPA: hypothetical protein VFZ65_18035 [Planctomycetota bacterium]|nr:hypothetical protein [Planctomycetota bacterium]